MPKHYRCSPSLSCPPVISYVSLCTPGRCSGSTIRRTSLCLSIVWRGDETTVMFLISKESHSHNQQHGKRKQNIALYSSATNNIHLLEFEDSCNPMEILGIGFSNTVHTISSFNIKMAIFCLTLRTIYPSLSVTLDNSRYIGQSRTGQTCSNTL